MAFGIEGKPTASAEKDKKTPQTETVPSVQNKSETVPDSKEIDQIDIDELNMEFSRVKDNDSLLPVDKLKYYYRFLATIDEQTRIRNTVRTGDDNIRRETLRQMESKIHEAILEEKSTSESQERESGIRREGEKLCEVAESFCSELQRRDKDGLDPFCDRNVYSRIRGGIYGVRALVEGQGRINADDLASALQSFAEGLKGMGKTLSGINDNPDSLDRLAFITRGVYDALGNLSKNFREGDENASRAVTNARTACDAVYAYVGRLRIALRNYMRR